MLFRQATLEAIATGCVTVAFRRWHRPTVRAGGALVIAISTVISASCGGSGSAAPSPYLDAARSTAAWLQSTAESAARNQMPDEAGDPSPLATVDIGTGAAGRSLFFLELFHATGDSAYLQVGIRELDAALSADWQVPGSPPRYGLYNGMAGVAFAASEFYRATGRDRFRADALSLVDGLMVADLRYRAQGRAGDAIAAWGAAHDVLAGTAGIGLALLAIHDTFDDVAALELAVRVGNGLLAHARPGERGWWWSRAATNDLNLPNFSHGTAGVGFFFARLAGVTGDERFRDAAVRAAEYIEHIADRTDGLFLVPYGVPDDGYVTAFDIGWAHGPAGVANLFAALARLTDDRRYVELVTAQARTLAATGMPGPISDSTRWSGPFRVDRRFGTSGAVRFLLRFTRDTPDSPYRALALQLVDDILDRGTADASGLHWRLPRYGFQGDGDDAAYTGFFYGASGLGLTLLDVHYVETHTNPFVRLPDESDGLANNR